MSEKEDVQCPICGRWREVDAKYIRRFHLKGGELPMCPSCSNAYNRLSKKLDPPETEKEIKSQHTIPAPCGEVLFKSNGRCKNYWNCEHQSHCLKIAMERRWEGFNCAKN